MSGNKITPGRIESRLARLLHGGTGVASVVIGAGLLLSLFNQPALLPIAIPLVTAGIVLFILLPILRVMVMFTTYLKERDYQFAAVAAVVLVILFAGCAVGILSK